MKPTSNEFFQGSCQFKRKVVREEKIVASRSVTPRLTRFLFFSIHCILCNLVQKCTCSFFEAAQAVLRELILISDNDRIVELDKRLQCSKYLYAAVKLEHLIPKSPVLFALTESSRNVSLMTELFACKILKKYASAEKKRPGVVIKSVKSVDRIEIIGG